MILQKFEGQSISAAVEKACASLRTDKSHLQYQVIQTPRHGFLGIGRRPAVIGVVKIQQQKAATHEPVKTAKPHPRQNTELTTKKAQQEQPQLSAKEQEQIISRENYAKNLAKMKTACQGLQKYMDGIFKTMGIDAHLEVAEIKAHVCQAKAVTKQPSQVIGYHGRRINALEELGTAYLSYQGIKDVQFMLNSGDYRQHREQALRKLMANSITKVIAYNQAIFLDPMPARERKLLHKLGEASGKVKTYSHGREPYRSVVIAPKD